MKRTLALAAALAFTVAACGDDGPTGPGGDDGEMEATVGGVPFSASAPEASLSQGFFQMLGFQLSGGVTTTISVTVVGAAQGETYTLNPVTTGTFGQVAMTSTGSNAVWTTILAPGTGSITFSTLNADRAAGTFQFTGQASTAAATGQKTVTSGTFDIEM